MWQFPAWDCCTLLVDWGVRGAVKRWKRNLWLSANRRRSCHGWPCIWRFQPLFSTLECFVPATVALSLWVPLRRGCQQNASTVSKYRPKFIMEIMRLCNGRLNLPICSSVCYKVLNFRQILINLSNVPYRIILSQLTDQTRYYIASDKDLVIDIFKSEINFLKSSWKNILGRPVVILTAKTLYLGT